MSRQDIPVQKSYRVGGVPSESCSKPRVEAPSGPFSKTKALVGPSGAQRGGQRGTPAGDRLCRSAASSALQKSLELVDESEDPSKGSEAQAPGSYSGGSTGSRRPGWALAKGSVDCGAPTQGERQAPPSSRDAKAPPAHRSTAAWSRSCRMQSLVK